MWLDKIIELAEKNAAPQTADMWESANICLSDAIFLRTAGRLQDSAKRAIDSLKYSVGIFHPDCELAQRLSKQTIG